MHLAYDIAPIIKGRIRPPKIESSYDGKVGMVVLMAEILANGSAESVLVRKGISPYIDSLAIQTIKQSKWKPAKSGKKPVDAWISVPINFQY